MADKDICYRFSIIRKKINLTQDEFSSKIGISRSLVAQIEKGHAEPSKRTISKIITACNINGSWLLTGNGPMFQALIPIEVELPEGEDLILPVVGEISAGEPIAIENQEPLSYINVSKILDRKNVYCFRVNGRSMEPLIAHNDCVIIRKTDSWDNCEQKVCALRIDGELTLKVLYIDHDKKEYVLMPINNEYKPIKLDPDNTHINLVGILEYTFKKW
ncbi:MAG: helix-turn-helix domain-containing protein [Bacteroidales bacterium]|nr:helix-turn-helix domain-containing protein [Bacteroidales bacterium]